MMNHTTPMTHMNHNNNAMTPGVVMSHTAHTTNHTMNATCHCMNHNGHSGGVSGHDGMNMYFTVGNKVTLFFEEWTSDTDGKMVGYCSLLFFIAILYEGLKVWRQVLLTRSAITYPSTNSPAKNSFSNNTVVTRSPSSSKLLSLAHFIQTLLHVIQVFVGYLLMLAFMTYNVWICIAVLLGSGLGYFAFGWKTATIISSGDHCN